MFIINYWLISIIISFIIINLTSSVLKLIVLITFFILLLIKKGFEHYILIILLSLIFLQSLPPLNPPMDKDGTVIKINNSNIIVKLKNQEVLVLGVKNANLYQKIELIGNYEKIEGSKSKYGFDKANHYKSQKIFYEIKPSSYKLSASSNWRYKWADYLNQTKDNLLKTHLIKTFFSSSETVFDSDFLSSIFYSKTLLINSLVYFYLNISGFYFNDKKIKKVFPILLLGLSYFFNSYLIIERYLIRTFLKKYHFPALTKWSFEILILLIINPFYIFQISFLIIESIAFLRLFHYKRSRVAPILAIIPINLFKFYEIDLIRILIYPLIRFLSLLNIFLIGIYFLFKNEYFLMCLVNNLKHFTINSLYLTGKPNLAWLLCWYQITTTYLINKKLKNVVLLLILLFINQFQSYFNPFDIVTYLNIGQGDSAIIEMAFSKEVYIIDTGNSYNYHYLNKYLKARGYKSITYLIITHQDDDHSGNKERLQSDFEVKNLVEEKEDIITKKLILYSLLKTYQTEDENDNSLIHYFRLNKKDYLFLGDISKNTERELYFAYPTFHYDFIKVAHHGSRTSTNPDLYQQAQGKFAFISSGYNNIYNHPHQETIQVLNKYLIKTFNTATDGDIFVVSTSFFTFIYTSDNQIYFIKD